MARDTQTISRGASFYWESLRRAIDARQLTGDQLAGLLGVGPNVIYCWLYGEFVPPLTKFRRLVQVLSDDEPGGTRFRHMAAELLTDAPEKTRRQMRADLEAVSAVR